MIISPTAIDNNDLGTRDDRYQIEILKLKQKDWSRILKMFSDAGIYQTSEYGSVSRGGSGLIHVVLKKDGIVVAAAQVRVQTAPKLNRGIAYVFHGPLWKRHDSEPDTNHLRKILFALKTEFAVRQKLLLRIVPKSCREFDPNDSSAYSALGFIKSDARQYKTIYIDLSRTTEEIRPSLSRNWRRHLNRAEKKGLIVRGGSGDQLFEVFNHLYADMMVRKNFYSPLNIKDFRKIQENFEDAFKMNVMICEDEQGPVAGIVGIGIGDTGIYLLGATSTRGLSSDGSYLLHWEMIKWLKGQGCRWYDLGGVDEVNNPGGYQFKVGMRGQEINFIGTYEYCEDILSKILVKTVETLRSWISLTPM